MYVHNCIQGALKNTKLFFWRMSNIYARVTQFSETMLKHLAMRNHAAAAVVTDRPDGRDDAIM